MVIHVVLIRQLCDEFTRPGVPFPAAVTDVGRDLVVQPYEIVRREFDELFRHHVRVGGGGGKTRIVRYQHYIVGVFLRCGLAWKILAAPHGR